MKDAEKWNEYEGHLERIIEVSFGGKVDHVTDGIFRSSNHCWLIPQWMYSHQPRSIFSRVVDTDSVLGISKQIKKGTAVITDIYAVQT